MSKEALGKGLSAIISGPKHQVATSKEDVTTAAPEVPSSNLEVASSKSEVTTAQTVVPTSKLEELGSSDLEVASGKTHDPTSNSDIASSDWVPLVKAAQKSGRITVWSPLAAAVLKYKLNTTPRFSMSDELRSIVEEGLERKYPELCKKAREQMRRRSDHGNGRV